MHSLVMTKGVKTITITLEAYEALLRLKRPGESFSDVILRLVRGRRSLMDLAGVWRDIDERRVEEIMAEVREAWTRWVSQRE